MEELRSTDILEKEIQNDAKKKAQSILEEARAASQKILGEVCARLEKAKSERAAALQKKEEKYKSDAASSLPLEKQRFLVSFASSSIDEALNSYFKNLSQKERLRIALKNLENCKNFFEGKKVSAKIFGFDEADAKAAAEKILCQKLSSVQKIDSAMAGEDESFLDLREGVFLECEGVRCRLTLYEAAAELKEKKSGQLCKALFGSDFGGFE